MQQYKWPAKGLFACGLVAMAGSAFANVPVVTSQTDGAWYERFGLDIGGSIRLDYVNKMGTADNDSYKRRGYGSSTRFRFAGEYALSEQTQLLGYYEPGVDVGHVARYTRHYDEDGKKVTTRRGYVGVADANFGELTIGKQDSAYYQTVGGKTANWLNDKLAQQAGVSIDKDDAATHRARNLINYHNQFGQSEVYVSALLSASEQDHKGYDYRRNGGVSLGLDQHLTSAWTWSIGYHYVDADLKHAGQKKSFDQQAIGTALSFKDNGWQAAIGAGYYRDFAVGEKASLDDYFYRSAYGVEAYLARTFKLDGGAVKSIKPYLAATRLQAVNQQKFEETNGVLGVSTKLGYGFRIDAERTFTHHSDGDAVDQNRLRLRYDF